MSEVQRLVAVIPRGTWREAVEKDMVVATELFFSVEDAMTDAASVYDDGDVVVIFELSVVSESQWEVRNTLVPRVE